LDWLVSEWIDAVGGKLAAGRPETHIRGVSTDSRTLRPNDLFVALRGPNFDGHDFCGEAVAAGAAALMVSRPGVVEALRREVPVVVVEDTLEALGRLAAAYLDRFSLDVAAISGSSGKTTTKEMLRSIIEPMDGLVSPGNFNNRIGVPLTVFRIQPGFKRAVFELAMNRPGELAKLVEIVRPRIVALTNVGSAHQGNFESYEALREAKAELVVHSPEDSIVVINADCPGCRWIAENRAGGREVVTFGIDEPAHYRAEQIEPLDPVGYRFGLVAPGGRVEVELRTIGRYNIYNALCAAAVADRMGIELERLRDALSAFRAVPLRSEILEFGGITVVADCYNANPDSVEAALDALKEFAPSRRKVFVFGDMLELGDESEMAHREVGQDVAERNIALFATIGEWAGWAAWEAARMGVRAGHFETPEDLVEALVEQLRPGDVVLVKGSRLMALERVIEQLRGRL